jgi:benzoyl-CoA reductase/2-hydroxyglutaryl-CoA dehydratase subunit BcrC/BadD/HgdB
MISDNYLPTKSRNTAKYCIERYFSYHGSFEEHFLDDRYVDLCVYTDICSGVDRAYEAISKSDMFNNDVHDSGPIEKDVKFVIRILQNMSKVVPQEFSAGILLMHLEFIEKIRTLN